MRTRRPLCGVSPRLGFSSATLCCCGFFLSFPRPPRLMGEGFVVMQSNDVDIYYYQDEPGELTRTNRRAMPLLAGAGLFALPGHTGETFLRPLQVWFPWSRRAPRRRRLPARTTSSKTCRRAGAWTSCAGRGRISTTGPGPIVRGAEGGGCQFLELFFLHPGLQWNSHFKRR